MKARIMVMENNVYMRSTATLQYNFESEQKSVNYGQCRINKKY